MQTMNRKTCVILLLLLWFWALEAFSQQARLSIEPEEILIGAPARMIIEVEVPAKGITIWPDVEKATENNIEVLRFGVPDTISKDTNTLSLRQIHSITAWKDDFIPIPPLQLLHIANDDTIVFETRAHLLQVKGIEVDMDSQYKDIKPLFNIPYTFREIYPYVLILLALAVIIVLLIRYFARPKTQGETPVIPEKPGVPAHVAAISGLETLKRKQLWQKGEIKLYYSELTDILRKYVSKSFHIDAIEMTTSEVMQLLPQKLSNDQALGLLRSILEVADLVKFARFKPLPDEHALAMDRALDFVQITIPEETKTE